MQSLEVSGAVRPIYGSLGVKRLSVGLSGIGQVSCVCCKVVCRWVTTIAVSGATRFFSSLKR